MTSLVDASLPKPPEPASKGSKVGNKRKSRGRPRKKNSSRKRKKSPRKPVDAADVDSYPSVNLVDEFTDTVSFNDLAFHHEDVPSLKLGDLILLSPDEDAPTDSASLDNIDPLSINSEGINLDSIDDPPSFQSNDLTSFFLLERKNEPNINIPLNSAGDALVGKLLREAASELHRTLGESEWRMKNQWIVHWRKLRYRERSKTCGGGKSLKPCSPSPVTSEINWKGSSTEVPKPSRKLPVVPIIDHECRDAPNLTHKDSEVPKLTPQKMDSPDHLPVHSSDERPSKTTEASQTDLNHVSGENPFKKKKSLVLKLIKSSSNEYTASYKEGSTIPLNRQEGCHPQISNINASGNNPLSVESSNVGKLNVPDMAQYEDTSSQQKSVASETDPNLEPSANTEIPKATPSTSKKSRTNEVAATLNNSQRVEPKVVGRGVSESKDNRSPRKTSGYGTKPVLKRLGVSDNGNTEGLSTPKKLSKRQPSQSKNLPQNITPPVESSCDSSFSAASQPIISHLDSTENVSVTQPDSVQCIIPPFKNLTTKEPHGNENTHNECDAATSRSANSFCPKMHSQDVPHLTGPNSLKSVHSTLNISSSPRKSCYALHHCTPNAPETHHDNINASSFHATNQAAERFNSSSWSSHQQWRAQNPFALGHTSSVSMRGNPCKQPQQICQICLTGYPNCGTPCLNMLRFPSVPRLCNVPWHPIVPQFPSTCQCHDVGGIFQSSTCRSLNFNARPFSQPADMPGKCPHAFHISEVSPSSQALSVDNSSRFCVESAKNTPFNLIGDGQSRPPPMMFQTTLSDISQARQICHHARPPLASGFNGDSSKSASFHSVSDGQNHHASPMMSQTMQTDVAHPSAGKSCLCLQPSFAFNGKSTEFAKRGAGTFDNDLLPHHRHRKCNSLLTAGIGRHCGESCSGNPTASSSGLAVEIAERPLDEIAPAVTLDDLRCKSSPQPPIETPQRNLVRNPKYRSLTLL